jgi:membrane protein DedA with SNARE-associated domain
VIIFLPVVVLLLVFGFVSGSATLDVLLPMVIVLAAGAAFVSYVLREGRPAQNPAVRQMPTDHLRRQMYLALRPQRRAFRQQQDQKKEESD